MKKILRWIYLLLAVSLNGFIIVYSCLSAETTDRWNNSITNFFSSIINSITEKPVKIVPVEKLVISFSDDKYNDIPGYKLDQIPLGSAKELITECLPKDATNTAVTYYCEDTDMVSLNQNGNKLSVVGMKTGTTRIHALNKANEIDKSYVVSIINPIAPQNFDVSIESTTIPIGTQQTLKFTIDGGVLGTNELINFRYYDIRKLSFSSSNVNAVTINEYGVLSPKQVGSSTITISNNNGISKSFNVNVVAGNPVQPYENLSISGSTICHGNDMILDQGNGKYHYQLDVYDNDNKLNPDDFIWKSSNELLAKVDPHGVVRGFRKKTTDDESVTITAISKLTGQEVSFGMIVKEQLPTSMYYWIVNGTKETWNPLEYTGCVGDNLTVNVNLSPSVTNKHIEVQTSNALAECTEQGASFAVRLVGEGSCVISFNSRINPELNGSFEIKILKAGAISTEDLHNVGYGLRKSLGHALVFLVAQVFTFLSLIAFVKKFSLWQKALISMSFGLALSAVSEIIQSFIYNRYGTFQDVLINFAGVVFGALMVIIAALIRTVYKNKHHKENDLSLK